MLSAHITKAEAANKALANQGAGDSGNLPCDFYADAPFDHAVGVGGGRDDRVRALFRQAHVVWIVHGDAVRTCVECFRRWRMHAWSQALCDEAEPFRPLSGVEQALINAQINTIRQGADTSDRPVGHVRRVDLVSGAVTDHTFIRHSDCRRCASLVDADDSGIDPELLRREGGVRRERSLQDIEQALFPLACDDRTGLIRDVVHRLDEALMSTASALLYPFRDPDVVEKGYGRSGRFGDDPTIAAIEALERYAGMRPRHDRRILTATYRELGEDAVDPAAFILHQTAQYAEPGFRLAPYDATQPIDWVQAYSWRTETMRWMPLQLAYFGVPDDLLTGDRFVYEVSNGCAVGSSLAEAALFGLLEVIERDAFLVAWHSGRPLNRIDPTGCTHPALVGLLARLDAEGLAVTVLDMGCGLPGAALLVKVADRDRRWGPYFTYAAAADLEPEQALKSALQEAVTTLYRRDESAISANEARATALLTDPYLVRSMDDHAMQCWAPEAWGRRSFPESDALPVPWREYAQAHAWEHPPQASALDWLAQGVLGSCHDILLVDQSFEPLAAAGLHCAKVLAPGLLPMTFGHAYRRIDWARIERAVGPRSTLRDDPHVFI